MGFGPMVARLMRRRNPFRVVTREQPYESRIFGHPPGQLLQSAHVSSRFHTRVEMM
jgi:hypothetical protein